MKSSPGRSICLVALALAVACDSLPKRGTDESRISIGQPTVFMRERSLVERFDDLEWLRLQRSPTKETEYEQGFQGSLRSAKAESSGLALKLALGQMIQSAAPSASPPATPDPGAPTGTDGGNGTTVPTADPVPTSGTGNGGSANTPATTPADATTAADPKPALRAISALPDAQLGNMLTTLFGATPVLSPRDKLLNRVAFRDSVAEEIRKRSLDDTHDLEGMALYELQFDLSILPGADAGDAYAVMLEVVGPTDPVPLDEFEIKRIIEAQTSACMAEIEEMQSRCRDRRTTMRDSTYWRESVLRGASVARYLDMVRILEKLRKAHEAMNPTWNLATDSDFRGQLDRLVALDSSYEPAASRIKSLADAHSVDPSPALQMELTTWKTGEDALSVSATRDRLLTWNSNEFVQERCEAMLSAVDREVKGIEIRRLAHAELLGLMKEVTGELKERSATIAVVEKDRAGEFFVQLDIPEVKQSATDLKSAADHEFAIFQRPPKFGLSSTLSSSPGVYDLGIEAGVRTPEEEQTFTRMLDKLAELSALDGVVVEDIRTLLRLVSAKAANDYAHRAQGFVIARRFAESSGEVLEYNHDLDAAGLEAENLLPVLLVGRRDASGAWKLPPELPPRVVSVTPSEVVEQMTTSAFSDIRHALSIALDGTFGGTVSSAGAAYERASQELRRYEMIARNPLLVGFVGGEVHRGAGANTFGWLMGPRLATATAGRAELRYVGVPAHNSVTATLIASARLKELTLRTRVFRILSSGEWIPSHTADEAWHSEESGVGTITLVLPSSPELIAQGMLARSSWVASQPRILATHDRPQETKPAEDAKQATMAKQPEVQPRPALWRLRARDQKAVIAILGNELWRNPQVYVGGQRATRVQIFSDLGGLWAEFDQVQEPAGQDGLPVRVDLIVSTSRGTDRVIDAVEILPPKSEPKSVAPAAQPSVQVVKADFVDMTQRKDLKSNLYFELEPPLPKGWSHLVVVVRTKGGSEKTIELESGQIVIDPSQPSKLEIKNLVVGRERAWDPIDSFELALKLRENPKSEPRVLHANPLTIVVVDPVLKCTVDDKVVLKGVKDKGLWLLSDAVRLDLTLSGKAVFEASYHDLYVPELKGGAVVAAKASGWSSGTFAPKISAKAGAVGRIWSVEIPKDTVLATTATLPSKLLLEIEVGNLRLSADISAIAKE